MEQKAALDHDAYLFHQGKNSRAYQFMGGHLTGGGATFRVWAPRAVSVSVIGSFNGWDSSVHPMEKITAGIWSLFIPGLQQYDTYKFAVRTESGALLEKADPYAFHAETRPATASKLYALEGYAWGDENWFSYRSTHKVYDQPMNIYEVHLGSWRRTGEGEFLSYRDIAAWLVPYVKEMGFTHVELMPVMEHPLDDSWGYQCTGYFAATSRFGTPHDLMYLIDQCHQAGVGVILDWVPAHFPKDAHGLLEFDGACCYESNDPFRREHPSWGTRVFDYGKNEVRSFLSSSARFWLEMYHADGLRVDAVASMIYLDYGKQDGGWRPNRYGGRENLEAISLLREINTVVFGLYPDILMIAEESTAFPGVSHPVDTGGLGFNLKWNMGWMNDTLHYCKLDPIFRQYHHKDITFSLMYAFSENFLLPISHDEVVHMKGSLIGKMPGSDAEKFAGVRVFYAYMLAHPGKKLLFMGCEFGQFSEWAFAHSLDWHLLEYPAHQSLQRFFKAAGAFYLENSPLWEIDFHPEGFQWLRPDDNCGNTAAFLRKDKQGRFLIVVCNFCPVDQEEYRLGVPLPGRYEEVFSSDQEAFGGSNRLNLGLLQTEKFSFHGQNYSLILHLPPLSAVFLHLAEEDPVETEAEAPKTVSEGALAKTPRNLGHPKTPPANARKGSGSRKGRQKNKHP